MQAHFQAIVDARSGATRGFEALARWTHATRGMVTPAEFIAVAEAAGLMTWLGTAVLTQACTWAAARTDATMMSVNVAPSQLSTPGFAQAVLQVLETAGLCASRLELEITEQTELVDGEPLRRNLAR